MKKIRGKNKKWKKQTVGNRNLNVIACNLFLLFIISFYSNDYIIFFYYSTGGGTSLTLLDGLTHHNKFDIAIISFSASSHSGLVDRNPIYGGADR